LLRQGVGVLFDEIVDGVLHVACFEKEKKKNEKVMLD
jgi:hypothetical protein